MNRFLSQLFVTFVPPRAAMEGEGVGYLAGHPGARLAHPGGRPVSETELVTELCTCGTWVT